VRFRHLLGFEAFAEAFRTYGAFAGEGGKIPICSAYFADFIKTFWMSLNVAEVDSGFWL
jgi:hypothetical protein